jgi:hypothetical protein
VNWCSQMFMNCMDLFESYRPTYERHMQPQQICKFEMLAHQSIRNLGTCVYIMDSDVRFSDCHKIASATLVAYVCQHICKFENLTDYIRFPFFEIPPPKTQKPVYEIQVYEMHVQCHSLCPDTVFVTDRVACLGSSTVRHSALWLASYFLSLEP